MSERKPQPEYTPRPAAGDVDYARLGETAADRFPKVHAKLAENEKTAETPSST